MNVLVTGATGFVGGHLVDRLLERGDAVTALVRAPARAAKLGSRGVRLVVGDLANHAALASAVAGQDLVIHAAAVLGAATEATLVTANRDGTANVVRACTATASPPRFVLVSSMAAGGPARHGHPRRSDDENRPVTMYGRSKLAAEQVLADSSVPWCVVRPPVVYGPRDRDGFLPLFKAVRLGVAPTFGDGSMELSLIHVRDLVAAIVLAGAAPGAVGQVFYVNHPDIVTAAGLIRAIARALDRSPVPVRIPRWIARAVLAATGTSAMLFGHKSILHADKIHEFYQEAWTADPAPFMAATGWQPAWSLERGLADTATWYRSERWL